MWVCFFKFFGGGLVSILLGTLNILILFSILTRVWATGKVSAI